MLPCLCSVYKHIIIVFVVIMSMMLFGEMCLWLISSSLQIRGQPKIHQFDNDQFLFCNCLGKCLREHIWKFHWNLHDCYEHCFAINIINIMCWKNFTLNAVIKDRTNIQYIEVEVIFLLKKGRHFKAFYHFSTMINI